MYWLIEYWSGGFLTTELLQMKHWDLIEQGVTYYDRVIRIKNSRFWKEIISYFWVFQKLGFEDISESMIFTIKSKKCSVRNVDFLFHFDFLDIGIK